LKEFRLKGNIDEPLQALILTRTTIRFGIEVIFELKRTDKKRAKN
jgi:hypothetical protein